MGSNLRACSLCAVYRAPEADSTRDVMRDGVTSDFVGPTQVAMREYIGCVTNLIACADDDMRSAEEAGNGRGV